MEKKVQWHPGFCAAMELEFWENRGDLEYQREYNLSRKPLQADLLVIKMKQETTISNEIGALFRKWNIMEYKSPDDSMNIDDFYKVNAYACLFKAQERQIGSCPAEDISISMIRQYYPKGLIQALEQGGFLVTERQQGIYQVQGNLLFQTQIVVSDRLEQEEHIWLHSLTNQIKRQEFDTLVNNIIRLGEPYEKECADAVLEVVTNANRTNIEEWKEDVIMCEALAKIMEPEIRQAKEQAKKDGWREGMEKGREEGREEGRAEGREEGRAEGIEKGIEKGMEKGMEKGREEGITLAKQVIRMDAQGCGLSEIAKKAGVTEEQVRAILA